MKSTPTEEKSKKHICCDGECNHDDCCGKIESNCPLNQDSKKCCKLGGFEHKPGLEYTGKVCNCSCHSPLNQAPESKEWEEEFDENFTTNRNAHIGIPENEGYQHILSKSAFNKLKELIATQISKARSEVREQSWEKGLKDKECTCVTYEQGYLEGIRAVMDKEVREEFPMGASQWLAHGKKYGYYNFFLLKKRNKSRFIN